MKHLFILSGVACLSFMLMPSCAPQAEEQDEPVAQEAPSTEADVAAIKNSMEKWEKATMAADVDGIMSLFTDTIIYMPPNVPALTGEQSVRDFSQEAHAKNSIDEAEFTSMEVKVIGDWAFDRGTYSEKITPKAGGESMQALGKYIAILEKQADGSWKYTHVIWNSDTPPSEEPAT
jgi:uncharacterized protein (TIGR02246 family)